MNWDSTRRVDMAEEQEKSTQQQEQVTEEASLLDSIVQATRLQPQDEAYSATKKGVESLIAELVKPGREIPKISKAVVDEMIAEIDHKLSLQVDEILHNSQFQQLESLWRGLKFLVDRTDFRENIKIEIMNVDKLSLLEDFEDAPEIPKSGLY
jgi:type VI secretion system protein ImpC